MESPPPDILWHRCWVLTHLPLLASVFSAITKGLARSLQGPPSSVGADSRCGNLLWARGAGIPIPPATVKLGAGGPRLRPIEGAAVARIGPGSAPSSAARCRCGPGCVSAHRVLLSTALIAPVSAGLECPLPWVWAEEGRLGLELEEAQEAIPSMPRPLISTTGPRPAALPLLGPSRDICEHSPL